MLRPKAPFAQFDAKLLDATLRIHIELFGTGSGTLAIWQLTPPDFQSRGVSKGGEYFF